MTTTLLQPYSPGQSYVFNGLEIPSQQTLPPAGQESFAFRPACSQLQETSIPGDSTQVSWGMSYNNNFYSFSVKPAGLSPQQAHLYLDAEGNCKINGVEVPLVPANLLPKDLLPESVVTTELAEPALMPVAAPSQGLSTQTMTGLAFILIGLAITISGLFSQKTTQVASSLGATEGASTGGQDSLTALMELLNSD